jgi:hypothetical protein
MHTRMYACVRAHLHADALLAVAHLSEAVLCIVAAAICHVWGAENRVGSRCLVRTLYRNA